MKPIESGCSAMLVNFSDKTLRHLNGTKVFVTGLDELSSVYEGANVWCVTGNFQAISWHGKPIGGFASFPEKYLFRLDDPDFDDSKEIYREKELV